MNQEKEKQYREELNILLETDKAFHYPSDYSDNISMLWRAYLAGIKKGDEEKQYLVDHKGRMDKLFHDQEKEIRRQREEIAQLKEELKLERECVDFYADFTSWESDNTHDPDKFVIDESDRHWIKDIGEIGGKLARSAQAQRGIYE